MTGAEGESFSELREPQKQFTSGSSPILAPGAFELPAFLTPATRPGFDNFVKQTLSNCVSTVP